MPAIPSTALLNTRVTRNATATNATSNALQVVCAFPVSGQYGPGTRILYYALIAACVFARKAEWLRNACLAAALLFPAVAALHGIVLTSVHVNGAVDMDIYGAFQLCSIGILAAPITVRLSRTYFYDPGRNTIFAWTGLVLAGLISLIIEFFRVKTFFVTQDGSGNAVSNNPAQFPYYEFATFGLTCSQTAGPFSPLRQGSQNNIYVIPVPDRLTFDTAALMAAACCIPAILSMVSMWNKILEINWKSRFGVGDEHERIEGTNGATIGQMKGLNSMVRVWLSAVEIPVFVAAVLVILIFGERNFWSHQVYWQTEPIASVGQWAPIVGTGLAVIGSLYLLLSKGIGGEKEEVAKPNACTHHCNCSKQEVGPRLSTASPPSSDTPGAKDTRRSLSNDDRAMWSELEVMPSSRLAPQQTRASSTADAGNRRKVTKALSVIGNYLSTASRDQFDDSEFKHSRALDFPEIPGEEHRNPTLPQIRTQYNQWREEENTAPIRASHSRAASIVSESGSVTRATSPTPRRRHADTMPTERRSSKLHNTPTSSSTPGGIHQRRATLEVPQPVHHGHARNSLSASSVTTIP